MSNALMFGVLIPLGVLWFFALGGFELRNRKLERAKEANRHLEELVKLDKAHLERMKIIETMKKAELDEALEQIDGQIKEREERVLGD